MHLEFPDSLGSAFLKIVLPLVLYALHGWFATWLAITLLFHPYEPKRFFFWEIQGIFPKRRSKLSQAVAGTITDTLLTTSDIKAQAETMLTEQNIYLSVDAFVDAVLTEFRDTTKLHRLANELSELSPAFLEQIMLALIEGVEHGKHKNIAQITERIFDQIVLSVRISRPQADEVAAWIMESIVTPVNIRHELIRMLSPQNIAALDQSINEHASGPHKFMAKIIGVKRVCYEWRNFLEKEPQQAEKVIVDVLRHFTVQDQISLRIANFDMRSLPLHTIAQIRQQAISMVQEFLVLHKDAILNAVHNIQGPAQSTVQSVIIRFNPEAIRPEWLERVKQAMAAFCYAYLKKELGNLLERAIPQFGVYGIIARKIELFSPQELEKVIQRICRQELKALEMFGLFIGLWLGFLQVALNLISLHP